MVKKRKKQEKKEKSKKNLKKCNNSEIILKVKRLNKMPLPEYALSTDVGFDLRASENVSISPNEQKNIKTGILVEIPKGHVGLIRDRAGMITKMGLHTVAGTFDPAYRGEVSVVIVNFGEETAEIDDSETGLTKGLAQQE